MSAFSHSNGDSYTANVDELEKQHFRKTIAAFKFYKKHMFMRIGQTEAYYKQMPQRYKEMTPDFLDNLQKVKDCVLHNSEIINLILKNADSHMFEQEPYGDTFAESNSRRHPHESPPPTTDTLAGCATTTSPLASTTSTGSGCPALGITPNDMDKVRSTLKQFVRDWSDLGRGEREVCYQPVVEDIARLFSPEQCDPREVRVLVPGAGLGRLAWEIAHRGYTCQGNEWSLYMLFPSYFILNTCQRANMYTLHPWVSQFCNNLSREHQLEAVRFPDVSPIDLPPGVQFSMAAGDFMEVYTEKDTWDCVATVFFIDTAHNILAYLETIWNILKPGGYWINMGPLLYHFADTPGEASVELSYDELKRAVEIMGFEFLKEERDVRCTYTQNPSSMITYEYNCVYMVVRKPISSPEASGMDSVSNSDGEVSADV